MSINWSARLIRYALFLFNLLFVITGIIMIAVGVAVKAIYSNYDIFLGNQYFSLPNLLIATGSLIFFISFFGCCGAYKESWLMIFIFAGLLGLIFILEFSAGIAGFVLRDQTKSYLIDSLNDSMKLYRINPGDNNSSYVPNAQTNLWDLIQRQFACCGIKDASNWGNVFKDTSLPLSCCEPKPGVVLNITCQLNNTNTSNYYHQGCVQGFGNYIKDHAGVLGGVGISIAIIELIGVVFAWYLARQIKQGVYST